MREDLRPPAAARLRFGTGRGFPLRFIFLAREAMAYSASVSSGASGSGCGGCGSAGCSGVVGCGSSAGTGSGVCVSDMVLSSLYNDPLGAVVLFFVTAVAFVAVCMALRK